MSALLPHLSATQAAAFARLGLTNVRREFPQALQHLVIDEEDVRRPRELHPAFYGSYDWHSCVHQHWMLVRLVRLFPAMVEAGEVREVLGEHLTPENVRRETEYLQVPGRESFQRPYGRAWLLKLDQELRDYDAELARAIQPLVRECRRSFVDYFRSLSLPVRHGVHGNTAVALAFALNWARSVDDQELKLLCTSKAAAWFGHDRDYPAHYEPCGEDFFSPALAEAGLMARILPRPVFLKWLDRFLPGLAEGEPKSLFAPVAVSDPSDPKIGHLIGLNLNRAWVWRRLAGILPEADARVPAMLAAAAKHYEAGLDMISEEDFHRAHWLASFAVYALTE